MPKPASISRSSPRGKAVQDIDYEAVAKKDRRASRADLKAVLDLAIESKLRERDEGRHPQGRSPRVNLISAAAI